MIENPNDRKIELLPSGALHDEFENKFVIRASGEHDVPTQNYVQFIFSDYGKQITSELHSVKWIEQKGIYKAADTSGEYVNIKDGERFTVGNPNEYSNIIYLFGPCFVWGSCVEDSCTLGSYLRDKIDNNCYIRNIGNEWFCMNWCIRNEKYKTGDIVIIFSLFNKYKKYFKENNIETYSIYEAYRRVPDLQKHVWDGLLHCNKVVMKEIADEVFQILQKENAFSDISESEKTMTFGIEREWLEIPEGLSNWLKKASVHKTNAANAGAIVMNCNPFTKGYRYLIEEASKQVDTLYIFVVEEDKSFFAFKDRLEMVSMGTSDLPNVVVIPSGKYMISIVTLPGYFNKEDAPYAEFDATDDLELFGNFIAKEFNIKIRFAGEEPNDAFTRHYNHEMERVLPKYGIKFCEIPRKGIDGQVISATTVRKYIKQKKWDKVEKLVLPKIYEYLYNHY